MTVLLFMAVRYGRTHRRMWTKVQAFHVRGQRRILSVKWNDFIPNVTVAATSGLDCVINIARARRLGLFSHVARFSRDVPASNIIHRYLLHFHFRFDGHFPDGSGLAGTRTSPFSILLELRMTEVVVVTTGATKLAKLPSSRHR